MINHYNSQDTTENVLKIDKKPSEIKQLINKALITNKIFGYLHNNILYMKSFGKSNSLDKIFAGVGAAIILGGTRARELDFNEGLFIIVSGVGCLILSAVFAKLLKYYLVYDIDREVFYTVTNIFNKTVKKTKEIARRDIVELGVNTEYKQGNRVDYKAINFKGDKMDNPGLRTSFVALLTDGKIVNISDPIALRQPHDAAVARCELFSECFGLNNTICNKTEYLKSIKGEGHNFKLQKLSNIQELEKAQTQTNRLTYGLLVFFLILIIIGIAIPFLVK